MSKPNRNPLAIEVLLGSLLFSTIEKNFLLFSFAMNHGMIKTLLVLV